MDNDCDGEVDEGATELAVWYVDIDNDGYGDPEVSQEACEQPEGFVADNRDCDDTDASVNPETAWYADTDGDGFGDADNTLQSCTQPVGYVADNTDCDDSDNTVYPGAMELPDGKDNDCDGQIEQSMPNDLTVSLSLPSQPQVIKVDVLLYRLDMGKEKISEVTWTGNDILFEGLENGTYLLMAVPDRSLHPSWTVTYSGGAIIEAEAVPIEIDGDMTLGLTIREATQMGGNGTIEGYVISREGASGGRLAQGLEEGTPLPNVPVHAISGSTGDLMATSISDATGFFRLEGLVEGNYTIKADHNGKRIDLAGSEVEVSEGNSAVQVSVIIGDDGVRTEVESVTGISEGLLELGITLYPNPVRDRAMIEVTAPIGSTKIGLYDSSGKRISMRSYPKGSISYEIEMEGLSKGLYLLRLESDKGNAFWKVVKE